MAGGAAYPVPIMGYAVGAGSCCPALKKQVVAAALNSVVLSVGFSRSISRFPMSAPMSTKTPALMLISAEAGSRQLASALSLEGWGVLVNSSLRIISGMLR